MINIYDLINSHYCVEYYRRNREKNYVPLNKNKILQRLKKRKNQYYRYQNIRKKYFANHWLLTSRWFENGTVMCMIIFGIPLLAYLFVPSALVASILFLLLLMAWGGIMGWRSLYRYVKRKSSPYHLLREERKVNPNMLLIDPSLNLYGELPAIEFDKGKVVVTLDRRQVYAHSFFMQPLKTDILLVQFFLHTLKTNFLFSPEQLKGKIQYQNKAMQFLYKRYEGLVFKQLSSAVKKFNPKISKTFKGLPFRCANCQFREQGCARSREFPKLKTKGEEDPTQTYRLFQKSWNQLLGTDKNNWKKDVKQLVQMLHSSPLICKRLTEINHKANRYDVKEYIESASFHGRRIANQYLSQTKKELAFSYQLLLYLADRGTDSELKSLVKYYGRKEGADTEVSLDYKIANFLHRSARNLFYDLDRVLQAEIPKEQATQIQQFFNNESGQMNINFDKGIIHAEMNQVEERIEKKEEIEQTEEEVDV